MTRSSVLKWVIKPIAFLLALVPLGMLAYRGLTDQLGADPIAEITHETGIWTLRFIVITLSITPLRIITQWSTLAQLRRMVGLFAFMYSILHFTTYIWLDQFFDVHSMIHDIGKRPFITIGFAAFVMLLPLAATSTNAMMRWLGGKRWRVLHRLIYAIAVCGVIHYYWLVKADTRRPLTYGAIVAVLLGFRFVYSTIKRTKKAAPPQKKIVLSSSVPTI